MSRHEKPGTATVKSPTTKYITALSLAVVGVALAAGGIYVGETDDAPGAALLGILVMIAALVLAVKVARRQP